MVRKARWTMFATMGIALVACGSDSKPAGSSSGALESCNNVCQKQSDKMCPNAFMVTVDQCKQLCAGVVGASSAACQAEIKAQSDCQLAKPDVCTSEAACTMTGDGGTACM